MFELTHKEELYQFQIINRSEISELIQIAYEKYDGVIILTSSEWDEKIRTLIADNLDLPQDTKDKFKNCSYHSAYTDRGLLNLHPEVVKNMPKSERLIEITRVEPSLEGKHFVFLDDSFFQCNSFNNSKHVVAIRATISDPNKEFYTKAINELENCKNKELIKTPEPDQNSNRFFQYSTKKIKLEDNDNSLLTSI